MGRFFSTLRSKTLGYVKYRSIRSRLFSGSPILVHVSKRLERDEAAWSLLYKNGLILTLGKRGILDYQDAGFGHFMGEGSNATHAALVQLHRIVLKSLLKYMVHRGIEPRQRDRAAEATATLWMAWEGDRPKDWTPSPLRAGLPPDAVPESTRLYL